MYRRKKILLNWTVIIDTITFDRRFSSDGNRNPKKENGQPKIYK